MVSDEAGRQPPDSRANIAGWGWFCAWGVVGAGLALGIVSLGPVTLVPAVLIALLLLSRRSTHRSVRGLGAGVGVVLLAVAWAQRDGPGTTCWHAATGRGCDEHLSPIPWLIAGAILVLASVAGYIVSQRRS